MDLIEFWTICSANGIILEEEQREQVERYCSELLYWNEKVNMISRQDHENILEKHILHSLALLKYVDIPLKSRCLDVGTGGGLPGIPIGIARPDLHILLVDSIAKKIKMTTMFAAHTGNRKMKAITSRVEDIYKLKDYKEGFDFIFARAVTRIEKLISLTNKIKKKSTKFIFLKGGDLSREIDDALAKNPGLKVKEQMLELVGYNSFAEQEKKLLVCTMD